MLTEFRVNGNRVNRGDSVLEEEKKKFYFISGNIFVNFFPNFFLANMAAVWVKAISSWLCFGIYMWTLVAPVVLPDRDFSV